MLILFVGRKVREQIGVCIGLVGKVSGWLVSWLVGNQTTGLFGWLIGRKVSGIEIG